MIMPNLGPVYYDEEHKDVLGMMNKAYAESSMINQTFWNEALINSRFECGDATIFNEYYGNLPASRRSQFNFNHIRRIINMISGQQRNTRKSNVAIPVENANQDTADQFTKVLMAINRQEGVLETISDAFHGALVTGLNFLQIWIDYRSDPISGNIKVDNCAYNTFLVDPFFKKKDLSDCNYIWKRSYFTRAVCISLLPDKEEEILKLPYNDSGSGKDGRFQYTPESYGYGDKNLLPYDEFYYRSYRKQKLLVDTNTGETLEWKSDNKEGLEAFLLQYPEVTIIETDIPTVNLAIVVQNKVMYDGPNPLGIDCYPFVPVLAYFNPQMPDYEKRIQSVVTSLRDPQYLFTRRKIIELDQLEATVTASWKYKEDALVNPKDVFMSGQGRGLALKAEASMDDVQQIPPPQIPPTTLEVSRLLSQEIMNISGVNEELMGSAQDDKAGILSMLRQGAGLVTLQTLFDNLDYAQKLLGRIMISLIQISYTPGKIKKLIQEEPTEEFYNKAFGKYDIAVEEGLNTTTQRQQQFAQLLHLKEVGVPISTQDLLEASTMQNKNKIIENAMQQEQQAQQMQQMQAQSAMQEEQARVNLAMARAEADRSLGHERESRIIENRALAIEKLHEANREDSTAALNRIKAIKELESMDHEHLEKLVGMIQSLKQQESAVAEQGVKQVASEPTPDTM